MTVPPQASSQAAAPAVAVAATTAAPPIAATLTDEERALLKQKRVAVFGSFQVSNKLQAAYVGWGCLPDSHPMVPTQRFPCSAPCEWLST